jgi:hypothetical protein
MTATARILSAFALAAALVGCSGPDEDAFDGGSAMDAGRNDAGRDAGRDAGHDAGTPEDDGGYDGGEPYDGGPAEPCEQATGSGSPSGTSFVDGDLHAEVALADPSACLRRYVLSSNSPLRDNNPSNPRTVDERNGVPTVRTNNQLFDALYALALDEAREDSVSAIQDGSFNDGSPINCAAGGCFETGRLWHYVWTRDTSYSVNLALGLIDPTRARNSLELKISERRSGGDLQIVQDTGTGGSYPISTDRVSWAMGAWELLKYLDGAERTAFRDRAYEALKNTVEHDRLVVYDSVDGLYSGETSFLDWREQTYPAWTATDVVHIGMSKSLSTNALHLHALQMAAALAAEKGDSAAQARYQGWADGLKTAIQARFWLPDQKLFSTFSTTFLDPAPTRRFDLLGESLAVLLGVADQTQATQVLASYPLAGKGPPTIWPQQQDTPIYHNRSSWPFVTAYWLEAARAARNDQVVNRGVGALMRGAALNLSNMENFELVTGNAWLDDGTASGPVINSQRQLWSVAGYLSMVQSVVFGLEATQQGIRFQPYVTRAMRNDLFAGADTIVLNNLPYRGHKVTVIVKLPARSASSDGAYAIGSVKLDGQSVGGNYVAAEQLPERATFEVELLDTPEQAASINEVTDTASWRNVFGPKTPSITNVGIDGDRVALSIDAGGEAAADIAFNVYGRRADRRRSPGHDHALDRSRLAGSRDGDPLLRGRELLRRLTQRLAALDAAVLLGPRQRARPVADRLGFQEHRRLADRGPRPLPLSGLGRAQRHARGRLLQAEPERRAPAAAHLRERRRSDQHGRDLRGEARARRGAALGQRRRRRTALHAAPGELGRVARQLLPARAARRDQGLPHRDRRGLALDQHVGVQALRGVHRRHRRTLGRLQHGQRQQPQGARARGRGRRAGRSRLRRQQRLRQDAERQPRRAGHHARRLGQLRARLG